MSKPHARFSIRRFLLQVALQLALLLVTFRYLAPSVWTKQVDAGLGAIILAFIGVHLLLCFFEWGFHRYVLHGLVHRQLTRFSRGHRHHHELTAIKLIRDEAGPGRIVLNRYPILTKEQYEDAAFPVYALAAFWIFFTPVLLILQSFMPNVPMLLGGYFAIAWSMTAYEIFHAVEHYPYEWWQRAVEAKRLGWIWKKVYAFHHFHHANISTNEAISGFFGLPVADWVFKTYNQPQDLLLHGRIATAKEFQIKRPWPFVTWLDNWARSRETTIIH